MLRNLRFFSDIWTFGSLKFSLLVCRTVRSRASCTVSENTQNNICFKHVSICWCRIFRHCVQSGPHGGWLSVLPGVTSYPVQKFKHLGRFGCGWKVHNNPWTGAQNEPRFVFSSSFLGGGDRDGTVVKVLCYKSEGRWFDPSWCQWIFH